MWPPKKTCYVEHEMTNVGSDHRQFSGIASSAKDAMGKPPVGVPWRSNNPALGGAFEPVFDERDDADLTGAGRDSRRRLNGVFMRNGPNPRFEPDAR